ncbi:chaplin [Streptomyces nodosus]
MRQATRKGLMTVAAATGVLAVTGGYAHADSSAQGAAGGSPGVLSGNSVQVPVHIPVNVCGNTVNVIGLLNPAAGNACGNTGGDHTGGGSHTGRGAHAGGRTGGSPGVGSGNHVQVPVDVPVNLCGNTVDVIGLGDGATGNDCSGAPHGGHRVTPPHRGHGVTPPHGGHRVTPPRCDCGHHTTPPGGWDDTTPPGGRHHTTPPGGWHHTTPPGGWDDTTPPGGDTTPPGGGDSETPTNPEQPAQPSHPGTPQQPAADTPRQISHSETQSVTPTVDAPQLAHTGSELPLGVLASVSAGTLLGGALLYRRARVSR